VARLGAPPAPRFCLVSVHRGAVDRSRASIKPEIPPVGAAVSPEVRVALLGDAAPTVRRTILPRMEAVSIW
jgi:hypothetical protein